MNWYFMNWYLWLPSAIAIAALIVSVVAIVYPSKAMAKQLKLQNYIEYTKRYQEIVLNFPENINEEKFEMSELDDEVRDKTMRYMRAYYDLCFEELDLEQKGFIDKKMWGTWKEGMEFAFSKPAFKQAWEKIKRDTRYSQKFKDLVDNCNKSTNKDI